MRKRLIESSIISIQNKRAIGRKGREAKIVDIDKKEEKPKDRALGTPDITRLSMKLADFTYYV